MGSSQARNPTYQGRPLGDRLAGSDHDAERREYDDTERSCPHLAGALALGAGMLLPQILMWTTTPSGRGSDRKIRRFPDAEARGDE